MQKYFDKMIESMDFIGLTPATQEPYIRRAKTFIEHTAKDIDKIDLYDIRNYMKYLKYNKKLSIGTINAYISAIRAFYIYGLEKEWDEKIVPRLKGYKTMPAILSKNEVFEILNYVQNPKYKAILSILYGSGLRVSEAVRLRIWDIDSKNMQIFIEKSKNRSDRYAILSEKTLNILRNYWKLCSVKPTKWLFPGANPTEHLTSKSVKNVMLKIKSKLDIKKKISSHTLRHCFATHLLEANCALPYIQQMLGHRSIKTTSKYLHMTSKAMMNIKSPIDTFGEDA